MCEFNAKNINVLEVRSEINLKHFNFLRSISHFILRTWIVIYVLIGRILHLCPIPFEKSKVLDLSIERSTFMDDSMSNIQQPLSISFIAKINYTSEKKGLLRVMNGIFKENSVRGLSSIPN